MIRFLVQVDLVRTTDGISSSFTAKRSAVSAVPLPVRVHYYDGGSHIFDVFVRQMRQPVKDQHVHDCFCRLQLAGSFLCLSRLPAIL